MLTINQFFNLQNESTRWVSRVVNSPEFAPIKRQMAQEMKRVPKPAGYDAFVVRQLTDLLDLDVGRILAGAWCKHQEIIRYRDQEKYPPGEVHLVPLVEHTVTSKQSPTIQPIINGAPLRKIKFDVVLKLRIKGAMLKIRDAKISEILVGSCTGSGSIEYAGLTLVERKTAPVNLPGSIALKEGIAI